MDTNKISSVSELSLDTISKIRNDIIAGLPVREISIKYGIPPKLIKHLIEYGDEFRGIPPIKTQIKTIITIDTYQLANQLTQDLSEFLQKLKHIIAKGFDTLIEAQKAPEGAIAPRDLARLASLYLEIAQFISGRLMLSKEMIQQTPSENTLTQIAPVTLQEEHIDLNKLADLCYQLENEGE